ncbi:MAG: hypothetical protein D3924_02845 [Candidatus Electrothrix sp. AR4]|nr:hypothetical protein [Candidatus Electrothrix sp. AR4]
MKSVVFSIIFIGLIVFLLVWRRQVDKVPPVKTPSAASSLVLSSAGKESKGEQGAEPELKREPGDESASSDTESSVSKTALESRVLQSAEPELKREPGDESASLDTESASKIELKTKSEMQTAAQFEAVSDIVADRKTEAEIEAVKIKAETEIEAVKMHAEAAINAILLNAEAAIEAIKAETDSDRVFDRVTDSESVDIEAETTPEAVPEIKADAKTKVKVTSDRRRDSSATGKAKAVYGKKNINAILGAERKATPYALNVLRTGRKMTLENKEIIRGGCWDYVNSVYLRAGYPSGKRKVIFKGSKDKGPYANAALIQPGDWLYYINHWYRGIGHSAIFVDWIDLDKKQGLMLSYGGEGRREPARYMAYDLNNVYNITRPRK